MQQYRQLYQHIQSGLDFPQHPPSSATLKTYFSRAPQQEKCVSTPICMSCCPIQLEFNRLGICCALTKPAPGMCHLCPQYMCIFMCTNSPVCQCSLYAHLIPPHKHDPGQAQPGCRQVLCYRPCFCLLHGQLLAMSWKTLGFQHWDRQHKLNISSSFPTTNQCTTFNAMSKNP